MDIMPNKKQNNYEGTAPMFAVFSNEPLFSVENKLLSLETLQHNLDLKVMMNNFAALVAKFIRPFNIRFQSAHGFFSLSQGQENNFSKSFNLSTCEKSLRVGSITYQSDKDFTAQENKLLIELHDLLLPNLKHSLKISELNAMVYKDHLTNIGNRAYYEASIKHAIEQSNRTNQGLSLMVLDINNFKPINDTHGHLKGDEILQLFAQALTKSIRTSDMVFRLGGDEFAIILQPAESNSITKVHQRLLKEIDKNTILSDVDFSSSIGFSKWKVGCNAIQLFEQADQHLYQQKALFRVNG